MVVDLDFQPGRYAIVCRVIDAKDARTHDRHGMMTELAVR